MHRKPTPIPVIIATIVLLAGLVLAAITIR